MKLDLRGRDWKSIDGFFIDTATREVWNCNGVLMGVLPSGITPSSGPDLVSKLKKAAEPEPVKKEEPVIEKKGISLHSLKNPPEPAPPTPRKKVGGKKKGKKKGK